MFVLTKPKNDELAALWKNFFKALSILIVFHLTGGETIRIYFVVGWCGIPRRYIKSSK